MSEKISTLFYHDWLDTFEELTDEEVGQLCKAILKFDIDGTTPAFQDKALRVLFSQMSNITKHNRKKYADKCERLAANRQKKTKENNCEQLKTIDNNCNQLKTIVSDTDTDIDTVIVTDIDTVTDTDTDSGRGRDIDTEQFEHLHPLPEIEDSDMERIRKLWNSQECTQDIVQLRPMTKRYDDTRLCIGDDIGLYLYTVEHLDKQEFFRSQAKKGNRLKYDWFCNPNNYIKVVEGNYKEAYKKEEEFDLEAWAKNG